FGPRCGDITLPSESVVQRTAAATPASRGARVGREIRRSWAVYLLLAPGFALLLLFTYFPAAQALYESFFNWQPGAYNDFVGLGNYQRLFDNPAWWIAWRNWSIFAVWHFTVPFVMPFVMAECIFNLRNRRLQAFFRVAVLVPTLIPGIVTLLLWRW